MNFKEVKIRNNILKRFFYLFMYYYRLKINKYVDISKKKDKDIFMNEKRKKILWPNKKIAAFTLQFDDFSVKSKKDGEKYDFGGDINSDTNILFKNLLMNFKFLKVTLFTIANHKGKHECIFNEAWPENKFIITNKKFKPIINWIKSFDSQIEIANHGLYHWQDNVKYFLHSREYEFKSKKESTDSILKAQNLLKKAGFSPKGFKPSGWGVAYNNNFALISALKSFNFDYVCLSTPKSGLNWDKKRVSNIYPQDYQGLLNIPQNINTNERLDIIFHKIDKIIKFNGIISLQLHFNEQYNWMCDGIGSDSISKIIAILNYVNKKYKGKVWFAKLEEIAKWWRKKQLKE